MVDDERLQAAKKQIYSKLSYVNNITKIKIPLNRNDSSKSGGITACSSNSSGANNKKQEIQI